MYARLWSRVLKGESPNEQEQLPARYWITCLQTSWKQLLRAWDETRARSDCELCWDISSMGHCTYVSTEGGRGTVAAAKFSPIPLFPCCLSVVGLEPRSNSRKTKTQYLTPPSSALFKFISLVVFRVWYFCRLWDYGGVANGHARCPLLTIYRPTHWITDDCLLLK